MTQVIETKKTVIAVATETTTKLISLVRTMDVAVENMSVARQALGNFMAQIVGATPTFEQYESIRVNFMAHWAGRNNEVVSDEAKRQAWSRAWGTMNSVLASMGSETISIPKSANVESAKKQQAREAVTASANAKIAAIPAGDTKAETKVRAELAKVITAKATTAEARKEKEVAERAIKILDEKARDAVKSQTGAMVKAIRSELSNATAAQLKQIASILGIEKI